MAKKRFDRNLYNMFDEKAKKFAKQLFKSVGLTAKVSKKKTDVDLMVYRGDSFIMFCETEIKTHLDRPFIYKSLHIPHRKEKYTQLELPTMFSLFSSDGSKYMLVWSTTIKKSPIIEVPNRYVSEGELFFDVKIKHCFTDIDEALKYAYKKDIL